ncbi:MAG TPA: hypothetical protein VGB99_07745 [Acidobacteriota bacterium]
MPYLAAVQHLGDQLASDRRYGLVGLVLGAVAFGAGLILWLAADSVAPEARQLLQLSRWIGITAALVVALACFGMGLSFFGLLIYSRLEMQARLRAAASDAAWKRWLPLDRSFRSATTAFSLNVLALLLFYWLLSA